jgi:site-specific DNA-adenine methylase
MLAGEYSSERGPTNRDDLIQYFLQLAARLRRVRVCCGDWSRVVTNGAMAYGATVGIFLDPPYLGDVRTKDLYRIDNHDIANEVREWAIENGDDNRLRIVLAGYEDEHAAKMPDSWRKLAWMGNKSYGTTAAVGTKEGNDANRANERLWFSPSCVKEMSLFEAMKL